MGKSGIMRYKFLMACSAFVLLCQGLNAQTDSMKSEEAVGQDQHYWKELPQDLPPIRNLAEVSKDTIPTRLIKTLRNSELYAGWETLPMYIDKNTGLYMLYLKKDSTITIYGFNEHGKPITYDSFIKPE
jgi:hypothetical protein